MRGRLEHSESNAALRVMHFLDLQVDFLRPLWRRLALVIVCLVWSVFEFATAAPFWGIIFGGLGVYALWQLFFDGWPEKDKPEKDKPEKDKSEKDEPEKDEPGQNRSGKNNVRDADSSNMPGD